jgi:hypothetical protein
MDLYAKLYSASVLGINGLIVEVEVDISHGLPMFDIVGLPDSAVREARERVRAALKNSEVTFPLQRITTNLAPADIKKEGSGFDLAIALGVLIASGQLIVEGLEKTLLIGELASIRQCPRRCIGRGDKGDSDSVTSRSDQLLSRRMDAKRFADNKPRSW